jgi:tRNA U34 5-methylaminomethyl-2-thiouridine-forming methyltransferase MnmC
MKHKLIPTKDGSVTIEIPEMQVTYHSRHGAVHESRHVYIKAGLHAALQKFEAEPLAVFEMGFGTGLNAWLTLQEVALLGRNVVYTAIEKFPVTAAEYQELNYATNQADFERLHTSAAEYPNRITDHFVLIKHHTDLLLFTIKEAYHLIYYDAFAPAAQPELWTAERFQQLYDMLLPGGILVTYCAKGDVRRAMQFVGFLVTKMPGPPGKREMIWAEKNVASL